MKQTTNKPIIAVSQNKLAHLTQLRKCSSSSLLRILSLGLLINFSSANIMAATNTPVSQVSPVTSTTQNNNQNNNQNSRNPNAKPASKESAASTEPSAKKTPQDAKNILQKGVDFYKTNGREKIIAEINNKNNNLLRDGYIYLWISRLDGTILAHGENEKLLGKNTSNLTDSSGKQFVKERMELAKTNKSFSVDYKFVNPLTKKSEDRVSYCVVLEDFFMCSSVNKD